MSMSIWGTQQEPAARYFHDRKHETIFFLDEIYERGLSNRAIAEKIKAKHYDKSMFFDVRSERYRESSAYIICDCAEPKSIVDLRDMDLMAMSCYKEPGCVEYRTKWMQHRKIVIDPARTPNAYREFVNYSYETDKDGNFLSSLPDKDNHTIDACAYALDGLIYRRGLSA